MGYDEESNVVVLAMFRRISERNGWDNCYLSQCGSEEFLKEMAGTIPSIMSTEISILQAGELGGNGWIGNSEHIRSANVLCWLTRDTL